MTFELKRMVIMKAINFSVVCFKITSQATKGKGCTIHVYLYLSKPGRVSSRPLGGQNAYELLKLTAHRCQHCTKRNTIASSTIWIRYFVGDFRIPFEINKMFYPHTERYVFNWDVKIQALLDLIARKQFWNAPYLFIIYNISNKAISKVHTLRILLY